MEGDLVKPSHLALVFASALSLTGCGRFFDKFGRLGDQMTLVRFHADRDGSRRGLLGFQGPLTPMVATLNGGVVIYAKNTVDGSIRSIALDSDEDDTATIALPKNTAFEFTGIGWEAAGLATTPSATNRVRCGYGPLTTFTENSASVNIDLSLKDTCHDDTAMFNPGYGVESSPAKTIRALSFVFCNSGDDLSDRTADANTSTNQCIRDKASSYFFKGDTSYSKMDRAVHFDTSGDRRLLFTATHFDDGPSGSPDSPYELYEYDFESQTQTKIHLPVAIGASDKGVTSPTRVPGKRKLLFSLNVGGANELWIYNLDTKNAQKLNGANAGTGGAKEYRVSADGNWVVWVADAVNTNEFQIFSMPIGSNSDDSYPGASRKMIGGVDFEPGETVWQCGACGNDQKFSFQITPDSQHVIFAANLEDATPTRTYMYMSHLDDATFSADINGVVSTYSSGTILGGAEVSANNNVMDQLRFSHNNSYLAYHLNNSGVNEVWARPVNFSATPPVVGLTVQIATAVYQSSFYLGKASNIAAYATDDGTDVTVNRVNLDGTSDFALFDEGVSNASTGGISDLQFGAGDLKVIVALHDSSGVRSIRSSITNVTADYDNDDGVGGKEPPYGSSVSYTGGLLTSPRNVAPLSEDHSGLFGNRFKLNSAKDKFIFISDMNATNSAEYELYEATVGTATPTKISGSLVADSNYSVTNASIFSDDVYFSYDPDGAGSTYGTKLFRVGSSPYNTPDDMLSGTYLRDVKGLGTDDDDGLATSGFPVMGRPLSAPAAHLTQEAWMIEPAATPSQSTWRRISAISGGANGLGRAQVRVMQNPDGLGYDTAFYSPCLKLSSGGSTVDGAKIDTDIRIPPGNGSNSPFYTVVDVFALSTDDTCSGTPTVSYTFPTGLAGSGEGANARLVSGTVPYYTLFLDEK